MDAPTLVALIVGVLGALIGAGSLVVTIVLERANRRELRRRDDEAAKTADRELRSGWRVTLHPAGAEGRKRPRGGVFDTSRVTIERRA